MKTIRKIIGITLLSMSLACGGSESVDQLSQQQENKVETEECCKICRKGKACGDSCINKKLTCHKAPGCACDG